MRLLPDKRRLESLLTREKSGGADRQGKERCADYHGEEGALVTREDGTLTRVRRCAGYEGSTDAVTWRNE